MNVLRNFTVLVAFYGKFATFSDPKKVRNFFSKNPSILLKKAQFLTFWANLPFESHFTANLLPWRFWKNSDFFSKNPSIFLKKTQTLNVLRKFTISVAFYIKFATFSDFEKIQSFFSKNRSNSLKKNPYFERFEKFYYFSRILRQICYL